MFKQLLGPCVTRFNHQSILIRFVIPLSLVLVILYSVALVFEAGPISLLPTSKGALSLSLPFYPSNQHDNNNFDSYLENHSSDPKFGSDPCRHWRPHGLEVNDPPECFRAKQFRQIQRFRELMTKDKAYQLEAAQRKALQKIELCALGVYKCPPRPLILSDYWYMYNSAESTSGEAIWLNEVWRSLEEFDFGILAVNPHVGIRRAWKFAAHLDLSLHMYLTDSDHAFLCLNNPRCVRQEDYTPSQHPEWQFPELSADEQGKIPSFRVFATSYWGNRPAGYDGQGMSASGQWGMHEGEWSLHSLGSKWHIVPFNYPKHTWISLSIERRCLASTVIPWEERNNSGIILAKQSSYFKDRRTPQLYDDWKQITKELGEDGISLISVAQVTDNVAIPEGFVNLGPLDPVAYSQTVSHVRAMVGIGLPVISPSPYVSICTGVPVVLPKWVESPDPEWAKAWHIWRGFQHGPASQLGEPWVYTYDIYHPSDMIEKIKKAVSTPIEPYIPEEMTIDAQRRRVREVFIDTDWEAEYRHVVRENGGVAPTFPEIMLETCIDTDFACRPSRVGNTGDGLSVLPDSYLKSLESDGRIQGRGKSS